MEKPAARIGDMHTCPQVSPGGAPHLGGPIAGPGCTTVWIEGAPAATVGDACLCAGGLDEIVAGSTGVFIEGREAARQGDRCAHGGVVVGGSVSVFIGDGDFFYSRPRKRENKYNSDEFIEPPPEEKERMLNEAIKECVSLLENKLELLARRDGKTMEDFKKWFGWDDDDAIQLIMNRSVKALQISKTLTVDNFGIIEDEFTRTKNYAIVNCSDEFYMFNIGDLFWKENKDVMGMANTLVHELSHFDDVGCTCDFDYGVEQCLDLSKRHPKRALYNASNFEYFIQA
ncbi:PAAR domain-containing protein [Longitalea luteola]|uniref:PAAR domain-containing protein n=1 Tax=Longitalea luteola TaxID=2812563 RepID=UPI001A9717B9|nr:PAAR domain-containing protein [Longitalea luteola]